MSSPKRNRARILTASGLKKLREQIRSHEVEENAGFKYTLERLGELTGLDPETVKNVLDCKGSDKRTIARCFESFGLTLAESDHIPAAQATTTADPNFVGRDEAIADLNTLVNRHAKVVVIQARGGVGKTTLARKYLQQEFGSFLEFPIAKETKDIASIEGLLEEKLRQLGEEPGREFLVSLDRLKRKLQAERIGILIDNLEPALDSAGKFIEAHRRYVELLRVLSDPIVQSITLITSRERLREADVTVQHYALRSLNVQAWSQFFQSRSINVETSVLAALHEAYGGNAKAMDIISGAVLEDFSGDVEAYWQANQDDLFIERDLEDLVTKQFDRLQELDSDAYKLLCRMGCYRYQDVPTVPIEGLFCLLWDVPDSRHRRVVKSLQDRSLVDSESERFWLHPVIRSEAIERLKVNENWKETNYRTAEYWTSSINTVEGLEQALQAFEAYYHYLEVEDFELAAQVFLFRRRSKWHSSNVRLYDSLAFSFYRLGLLQQLVSEVTLLTGKVSSKYFLSRLHIVIGAIYWMLGYIHKAIEFYLGVENFVNSCLTTVSAHEDEKELSDELDETVLCSFIMIGLCKIDLWELEEAVEFFKKFASHPKVSQFSKDLVSFTTQICFSQESISAEKKERFLDDVEKAFSTFPVINSYASALREYGLLFLGSACMRIGEFEKSLEIYNRAISVADNGHGPRLKSRALVNLGELYRAKGETRIALSYLLESVKILEKIRAKPDLAEAYYQLGLTYQEVGETKSSDLSFQESARLFTEMEAPKQVERVRHSMQNSL